MKSFEDLGVRDYLAILRRRIWYLLLSVFVAGAGTAVWLWRTPSIYRSEATIFAGRFLPEETLGSLDRQPVNERIDFVRQQLQSRNFLERMARAFNPGARDEQIERQVVALRSGLDFTAVSPSTFKIGYRSTDPVQAQIMARRLAEGLIQLNKSSRKERVHVADDFLEQEYNEAARNLTLAEQKLYKFRAEHHVAISQESGAPDILRGLQSELSVLEDRLADLADRRKVLDRRLSDHEQLRRIDPVTSLQSQLPVSKPGTGELSLLASPEQQALEKAQAELALARGRLTPDHPDVRRLEREVEHRQTALKQAAAAPRIAPVEPSAQKPAAPDPGFSAEILRNEILAEIDQVERDTNRTQQSRAEILDKISRHEASINPSSSIAQQLAALTREYESAKQLHGYLEEKKRNTELASRVDLSDENEVFTIIDPANLPQAAIWPNRLMFGAAGLAGGVLLGLGLAFLREYLDPTLHDDEEAALELKLPVLACIPKVAAPKRPSKRADAGLHVIPAREALDEAGSGNRFHLKSADPAAARLILDNMTAAGEQFRMLRARLSSLQKHKGLQSLLITGALPDEGKSFVACCLAGALARGTRGKVLLIDLDLRRRGATKLFGVGFESAGVSELLGGATTALDFERVLWKCADLNLYLMPPGARIEDPAVSLDSPEVERIVRHAKHLFDWVIIDSPPALLMADANVIAPLCDSTVLVVNSGQTPKNCVKDTIDKIGRDRICGIVMNRFHATGSQRYIHHYQHYAAQPHGAAKESAM